MIDFHTHILPEIDDGAQSIDESLDMLKMLKEQGVNTVALTSHYIAVDESPDEFLQNRQESFQKLCNAIKDSKELYPRLLMGAEVYYYPGIFKMEQLSKLKLHDTNAILIEMPMAKWSEYSIKELVDFALYSDTLVVLAHIERYLKFIKKGTLERLLDSGVLMQVNTSFFNNKKTRKKALKMFDNGYIHFIGSDCHNLQYRPPTFDTAIQIIEDKFSKDAVDQFFKEQREYLNL